MAVLLAIFLIGPPLATAEETAALSLSSSNPAQGKYLIEASGTVSASPETLARVLVDFENQCETGCTVQIPSVDRNEIVGGSFEQGSIQLWTQIDDILDATYWSHVAIERRPGKIEIRLLTPTPEQLEAWSVADRPHKPFFHLQDGTWTFEAQDGGTSVSYRMTMESNRFMINLMPSQVLRGAELHTRQIFDHLQALDEEDSPAEPSAATAASADPS